MAAIVNKSSKSRESLSFKEKLAIIEEIKNGCSQAEVARKRGMPRTSVNTIWVNRAKLEAGFETSSSPASKKRCRRPQFDMIDEALWKWFNLQRSFKNPITGPILLEKAKIFAEKLNVKDFKGSSGWLEKWKSRHDVSWRNVSGEAADVDMTTVTSWFTEKWPRLSDEYKSEDVFNCDETGLFWRILPDKSLSVKNEQCVGGKLSKERLTVLLCANMTGNEKLTPLVIGKSANPRAFKRLRCKESLPVIYRSNKKAWMTSALFVEWLQNVNSKMKMSKRKILLIMDNCPAHPHSVTLTNVKLVFLPANTTSVSQPLDQGIIQNFKVKYRGILLRKTISAMEGGDSGKIDILDAVLMLNNAWSQVTATTIANCFRKAGFCREAESVEVEEQAANIPIQEYADLQNFTGNVTELEACFREVDNNLILFDTPSDDDILEEVCPSIEPRNQSPENEEEDEDVVVQEPEVTHIEALNALKILKSWVMQQETPNGSVLTTLSSLEDTILLQREGRRRQLLISNFVRRD